MIKLPELRRRLPPISVSDDYACNQFIVFLSLSSGSGRDCYPPGELSETGRRLSLVSSSSIHIRNISLPIITSLLNQVFIQGGSICQQGFHMMKLVADYLVLKGTFLKTGLSSSRVWLHCLIGLQQV